MGNALLFTGLLLGAAVLGGFIGSCCASKRKGDDGHEARMERVDELEFLIGETPTGGLLGRVGALEDAARKEAKDAQP